HPSLASACLVILECRWCKGSNAMACVHAVTAKASATTKNFIALSSSVKSARDRKRQLPAPHLAKEPKWSRSNAHHRNIHHLRCAVRSCSCGSSGLVMIALQRTCSGKADNGRLVFQSFCAMDGPGHFPGHLSHRRQR